MGVSSGKCCGSGSYQPLTRKPKAERLQRSAAATRTEPRVVNFSSADPSKWVYPEITYDGGYSYHSKPEIEECKGSILEGVAKVKADPSAYEGLWYQTNMASWDPAQQEYTLVKRTGSGFQVRANSSGAFTFVAAKYQALDAAATIKHDKFTDELMFHSSKLPEAICPARGQGVCDVPSVKIIGDVDPTDISQGQVGDCWLLSAISALAEYDGAIQRLFRKTPNLEKLPHSESNTYIVTLWDIPTWTEVDIEVDERLCSREDGKGLLGCTPSVDGELWVCYLEKAIAIHCGGWDKIDGGTCVHAWRMLLGAKDQYTFRELEDGSGFACLGAFNPNKAQWEELANSPHDGFKGLWPMRVPKIGEDEDNASVLVTCSSCDGKSSLHRKLSHIDLFRRMCIWHDNNFLMCCGTKSGSDSNNTDGIVDGHAYSILDCVDNAGGTEFNMIKVRNPWGKGEFEIGLWDDDGPNWEKYPAVKEACKPVKANDGVFWMEQDEFFQYFKTVYLCAKDLSEFLTDK